MRIGDATLFSNLLPNQSLKLTGEDASSLALLIRLFHILTQSTMNYKTIQHLALIVATAALTGCWTQHDTVSIRGDGSTEFTSEVTITEKDFSLKDVDEISAEFMKELKNAGWKIDRKIHTSKPPYCLTFTGSGNIKTVKTASDFYVLTKLNDKEYSIRFVPAETKGGKSSRSMAFNKAVLASDAKITDSEGKPLTRIENVHGNNVYKITLD